MSEESPLQVMAVIIGSFRNCRCTLKLLQILFQNFGFDSLDYADTIQHLEELQSGEESKGGVWLLPIGQAQAIVTRKRRPDLCKETDRLKQQVERFLTEGMSDWSY